MVGLLPPNPRSVRSRRVSKGYVRLRGGMEFQIRRAKAKEAAVLTEIAHAAKRHWGYPENWIEHWEDDLTITPDFIAKHEVYVAMIGDDIAGCCALVIDDAQAELEHMWVKPEHIGIGVGKALFMHVAGR